MRDTDGAAEELQFSVYRRMTGAERLRIALDLTAAARGLAKARLRKEHPAWSEDDLKRELIRYAFMPEPPPHEHR